MVEQLRSLVTLHNLPSVSAIADRMQQLAELSERVAIVPRIG